MTEQYAPPSSQESLIATQTGLETLALADSLSEPNVMRKIVQSWDAELEDAGMQHVVRLDERADQQLKELIASDGDMHAQIHKDDQIKKIRDTQSRTFGSQYDRYKDIQAMKRMYKNYDEQSIPIVGKGASEMAAHFVQEAEQFSPKEQVFIDSDSLRVKNTFVTIEMKPDDEPYDIPLGAFVAAEGFESWEGRGVKSSSDKIADYASLETPIPPVAELYGFVLPNGKMIYKTANSHRVGAAIKKGDTTIPFKGSLTVSKLNYFPVGTTPEEELETEAVTTANGKEIEHPRDIMDSNEFQKMASEYGFDGTTAQERVQQLKTMNPQKIALFLADINSSAQGSEDTLVSDKTVNIGGKATIPPQDRYDVFMDMLTQVATTEDTVSSERVGDVVALGTVLLHPFADGNGRTARLIASLFRPAYDNPAEYSKDYDTLVKSRDKGRENNEYVINGYVPQGLEDVDQSDPQRVKEYFSKLLTSNEEGLYTGPYGQVPLTAQ